MTNNQIAYQNLKEQERANRAKEFETNRSNVVKEIETQRHNEVEEYNNLIGKLNNPFSLISHGADGEQNAVQGLQNIANNLGIQSIFGNMKNTGKISLPKITGLGNPRSKIPPISIFDL